MYEPIVLSQPQREKKQMLMNLTKDLKTFIMLYGKLSTSCADVERKFSKISAGNSESLIQKQVCKTICISAISTKPKIY